jgi:RHS repeat-associated protein
MSTSHALRARRTLAALLALAQLLLGCPPANPPLAPALGYRERCEPNLVAVPGGLLDVAGGKLLVQRTDLVLDTRLGREVLGAVYDSAAGAWRWSFESRYDGATFVDESGASFAVGALAAGAAIPGTWWVKLDATRMKTKGGLVHEYGAAGLLAARYWASDPYPRIRVRTATVGGALRIVAMDQCTAATACSALFAFGYDGAGRLVEVVDRAGRRAEFAWDSAGRLASARDALDVANGWPGFRYTYLGSQLASLTNSEGERIEYAWSGAALASVTQLGPGSPVHRFAYEGRDGAGLYHTRAFSPLGEERRYAYDGLGRLLERHELASGERTRWTWSGQRIATYTAPNGATTSWTWSDDDVRVRTDPSGNVVSFSYQPNGVDRDDPRMRPVAAITDSLGLVEARRYDAVGRLVERRNGANEVTSFSWAQGALASERRLGITRSFAGYGEHGHAEHVSAFELTEVRAFDAVGNLLRGSDARSPVSGGVALRSFDADRNLAAVTLEPAGAGGGAAVTLQLAYRSDGQRTRVLRGGDDHRFVYDAFGRLVEQRERVDGVWQTTRFGHDAAGRPLFTERPNGMREEVSYGPADRVASVRRLRSGALEGTLLLAYEDGALVRVEDSASGVETYAYDAAGRRVTTRFADGERLEVEYDVRSRPRAEHFVDAQGGLLGTLRYGYDLADRRTEIADASGALVTTVFEDGRIAEQRTGNGLVRSWAYRSDGILSGTTTRDAAGGVREETALTGALELDETAAFFRLRQRATTETRGGVDVITVEEYELSPVATASDEAPGARVSSWNDGLTASEGYAFDARSNLLAMGSTSFAYNAEGNRLLTVTRAGQAAGSYAWDAAGFATARNGVPLAWDAAGRLRAHGADTLAWDGLGRLRAAEIGGVSARFGFGGRVQEDAAGAALAIDLGEVLVGFAGTHRYRHLDFRGNVKFVSDDAGEVVAHYRYAPFGLDAVFGADDDGVRFVARPEFGELMLLGARVYDPAAGRFLSPDPLFQIVNQFAYTLGNPVWFSDPAGLSAEANQSAAGFDLLIGGLSLLGATFGVLAALLKFAPVPQLQLLGAILGLAAALIALLIALALLFGRPETKDVQAATPQSPGAESASGGVSAGAGVGGAMVGGVGGAGCSPAALTALPNVTGWLRVLLPLQLLLGWLVLRRRREERA